MMFPYFVTSSVYGNQLFILASLELWFRVFIDSSSLEYPQGSVEDLEEALSPRLCQ